MADTSTIDPLAKFRDNPATKKAAGKMDEANDRFMTLLITQLKNQDPLNPMENAEMTSQLAQMSTVTELESLNKTVEGLINSMAEMQSMQSTSMIGKAVIVPGDGMLVGDIDSNGYRAPSMGAVNLAEDASYVKITMKDEKGAIVATQEYEKQKAGRMLFSIETLTYGKNEAGEDIITGGLPAGKYTYSVSALDAKGKPMNSANMQQMQIGTVTALARENGKFMLDLGQLGKTDFSKVTDIYGS